MIKINLKNEYCKYNIYLIYLFFVYENFGTINGLYFGKP